MDIRHLSAFVAVAEELHFGRAAKRLMLSQSAVSRAVSQLEAKLGAELLERSTHHVSLTVSGKAFLEEAQAALRQIEVAERVGRGIQEPATITLRIAHTDCVEELLPPILRIVRRRLPSVTLNVRSLDRLGQVAALREGEVDVALRRATMDDGAFECEVILHEPVMVALPAGHSLASSPEPLSVSQLAGASFVIMPGSPSHERLDSLCQSAGFCPTVVEEVATLSSMTVLVASGVGVGLVPASASGRFQARAIVCRRLGDSTTTLPAVMAWRRGDRAGPLQTFLRATRTVDFAAVGWASPTDRPHHLSIA